jgi:hypothetical protein
VCPWLPAASIDGDMGITRVAHLSYMLRTRSKRASTAESFAETVSSRPLDGAYPANAVRAVSQPTEL